MKKRLFFVILYIQNYVIVWM